MCLCRSKHCVVATANFQADRARLQKTLHFRHAMYQHSHAKPMSCNAVAQLLSNTLYYKRFFPYYCYNMVCGLDQEGKPTLCACQLIRICQLVLPMLALIGTSDCMQSS